MLGRRRRPWLCAALLLRASGPVLAVAPPSDLQEPAVTAVPEVEANEPQQRHGVVPYDCEADYSEWESAWSSRKKAWCCGHAKRGCPVGSLTFSAYNCTVGDGNRERGWSPEKKAHCCLHASVGCDAAAAVGSPLDARAARGELVAPTERRLQGGCSVACGYGGKSFSCGDRVRYIAAHHYQGLAGSCEKAFGDVLSQCSVCADCPFSEAGCSAPRPPPLAPAAAPVPAARAPVAALPAPAAPAPPALPVLVAGTPAKRAEGAAACSKMCSYKGKSASCSFRIQWGAHHRYLYQDQACKKAWIMVATQCSQCTLCPIQLAGCVEQPRPPSLASSKTPRPFDCMQGHTNRVAGWSEQKRDWCCKNRGRGCVAGGRLGEEVPYDCLADVDDWQSKWNATKQRWCCEHRQRGCHENKTSIERRSEHKDSEPSSPDCDEDWNDWKEKWSDDKKAWCCKKRKRGCPEPTVLFDCLADYQDWEDLWSDTKIHWCCRHRGKGCPSAGAKPFECSAGVSNAEHGWSEAKKEWCCSHEKAHCPSDITFDCHEHLVSWRRLWAPVKKEWCCKHEEVHCDDEPYDCDRGLSDSSPREQLEWCCEHEKKGCVDARSGAEAKFAASDTVPTSDPSRASAWTWTRLPVLCAGLAVASVFAALLRPPCSRRLARARRDPSFQPMPTSDEA